MNVGLNKYEKASLSLFVVLFVGITLSFIYLNEKHKPAVKKKVIVEQEKYLDEILYP
jgi:hypothetical protein